MPKPVSVSITANASGVVKATSQVSAGAKQMAADVTSASSKIDAGMDKAAAAANRLAAAERKAANAAGQVRVAESQMAAVRSKSSSTDAQKIRAEEKLYAANRRLAASQAEAAEASKALSTRGSFLDSFTARSSDIDKVSTSMLKFGTVSAAGLGLVAKAAIDWDSAWAGVTKTVDGTPQQLSAVESGLRGLARTMPETAEQIAAVAANAGQLGIKTPDIVAFTRTMVELGDTTNLSSDEAATSFGQLLNVMGDAPSTVGHLGDVLLKLGLDGASSERNILDLGTRLAGAGKQVGLSTPQVLAFGSAIASTGIEAEAGGTAMSQNFFAIDKAVRQGGSSLDLYAKTAGMSSAQFRKAWGDDPASATNQFIEGLGKVQKSGGSVRGLLDDLGIKGSRQADVYARLAGATKAAGAQTGLLASQLKDVAEADGTLTDKSAIRYATQASQIKISVNKIKDDAITAGAALLPVVSQVTHGIDNWADSFSKLSPGTQGFLTEGAAVGTVALLAGGGMLSAASSAVGLASSFQSLAKTAPGVAGSLRGVAGAAGAVGLAVVAAEAAGGVYDLLGSQKGQAKNQDDVTRSLTAYATAADKGAQASLDLSSAYPKPNTFNFLAASIGADSDGVQSFTDAVKYSATAGSKSFLGYGLAFQGFIDKIRPGKQESERVADAISKVDASLSTMVTSGHADQAALAFKKISDDSGVDPTKLVDKFGTYRDSLLKVADAAGVTSLSQKDLADWMGGKVPQAVSNAAKANPQLAASLGVTTSAVDAQKLSLQQLAAQASATSDALVAASNSEIAVQQALGAARKTASSNAGKGTNIKTAAGQANQSALNNVISAQHQSVQTEASLPHPDYAAIVKGNEAVKKSYVDTAEKMGVESKKAKADADKNFVLPKTITSQIVVKTDKLSSGEVTKLNNELKGIPKEQRAKIVTIAETKGAKAAETAIARVKDKKVIARADGESGGAKDVKKAMDDLHDRLVLAKARGDKSGADDVRDAMQRLKSKQVAAKAIAQGIGNVLSLASAINSVHSKSVTVTTHSKRIADNDKADGGLITHTLPHFANGSDGRVAGVGGPRQDNIAAYDRRTGEQTAWVSVGEMVTNEQSTSNNLGPLTTINANPDKSYGLVELAEGGVPGLPRYAKGKKTNYNSDPRLLAAIVAQQNVDEAENLKERTKADKALEAATKHFSDSAKSLTDAATQLSKSLVEPYQSKTSDAQDFLVLMQQGATDLKGFAGQIKQLKDMGLSQTLIDQVTAMGADTGSSLAQSILAGGQSLVDALDTANTNLTKAATAVGVDATGVKVKGYASGGPIYGPGTGTSDDILLRASHGEWMVPERAARIPENRAALSAMTYGRQIVERNYAQTSQRWAPPVVMQSGSSDTHDYSTHVTMHGGSASADQLAARIATRRRDALARRGLVGRKV